MHFMSGLTIIVAGTEEQRFHSALSLAAANAALGRRSRLFLQGEAAALLRAGAHASDARLSQSGVPTITELVEEALAMGVEISVCQSGLALAGMVADALPHGVATGGLVEMLSSRGDDQLLMV